MTKNIKETLINEKTWVFFYLSQLPHNDKSVLRAQKNHNQKISTIGLCHFKPVQQSYIQKRDVSVIRPTKNIRDNIVHRYLALTPSPKEPLWLVIYQVVNVNRKPHFRWYHRLPKIPQNFSNPWVEILTEPRMNNFLV